MTERLSHFPEIFFIVGPTAIGKSEIAFQWAQKIKGEIISCDSMQVYREITVASSKPTLEMINKVKHHLIGIIGLDEKFDVAQFNSVALKVINEINDRQHIPIIVGGSGLYMAILLDGIFSIEKNTEAIRKVVQEEATLYGATRMYEMLEKEDLDAAKKIHPHDVRRIIRALEICRAQGQPISSLQKKRQGLWGCKNIRIFGLTQDRAKLYTRINQRVEKMFKDGLVDEIRRIETSMMSSTSQGLIGIKEVLGFLRGEYDEQRAKELLKLNTRHLAKRQMTWFRKDKRIEWIDIDKFDGVNSIILHIDNLAKQPMGGAIGNP